jgi:hypothetical protein
MISNLSAHNWVIVGGAVVMLSGWIGVVLSSLRRSLMEPAAPQVDTRPE